MQHWAAGGELAGDLPADVLPNKLIDLATVKRNVLILLQSDATAILTAPTQVMGERYFLPPFKKSRGEQNGFRDFFLTDIQYDSFPHPVRILFVNCMTIKV